MMSKLTVKAMHSLLGSPLSRPDFQHFIPPLLNPTNFPSPVILQNYLTRLSITSNCKSFYLANSKYYLYYYISCYTPYWDTLISKGLIYRHFGVHKHSTTHYRLKS